jgi:hypothetical protein
MAHHIDSSDSSLFLLDLITLNVLLFHLKGCFMIIQKLDSIVLTAQQNIPDELFKLGVGTLSYLIDEGLGV